MKLSRRSSRGYTLIETLLVVGLLGGIAITLSLSLNHLLNNAEQAQAEASGRNTVFRTMSDIGNGLRVAEAVHRAGEGILEFSSRYYYDDDDSLERVRILQTGSDLVRQVSNDDGASYSVPEAIAVGIVSFSAYSILIEDSFDPAHYDALPVALTAVSEIPPVDTAAQASYRVMDLPAVDPDLSASYDSGSLLVRSGSILGRRITVSPSLPREDLSVRVKFVPLAAGGSYTALLFGEDQTGVSVYFGPLGAIRSLSTHNWFPIQAESAGTSWVAGQEYWVEMGFCTEAGWIKVSTVDGTVITEHTIATSDALVEGSVSLTSFTPGLDARWDDLRIRTERVRLTLDVNLDGTTQQQVSRIAPRSW